MRAEKLKSQVLEDVLAFVGQRIEKSRAGEVATFIRQFYANVPQADIAGDSAVDLFAAALSLWNFAQRRSPGTAKVRVFNPRIDEHGWRSAHSIVEIVNDDMPFLVDSVTAELNRQDLGVHLVIHPILALTRNAKGEVTALDAAGGKSESIMQLRINQIAQAEKLAAIKARIEIVLADVRRAVADWREMRQRLTEAIAESARPGLKLPADEIAETVDFLKWIEDDNFTFLGYREYVFADNEGGSYRIADGRSLGILADHELRVFDGIRNRDNMPADIRNFLRQPRLLLVTKANLRSSVHRNAYLDTLSVKMFDAEGRVIGERLFAGLFTSIAYSCSPWDIPLLRRKVETVAAKAGFAPGSHDAKALAHILETYPRDELFQIATEELLETALGILHLQERQRVALFARRDPYERFMSCLVYLPRDSLTTRLREKVQAVLAKAFAGKLSAFYVHLGESALARLHIVIATVPGALPAYDLKEVEALVAETCRSWQDRLQSALVETHGEAEGLELLRRYAEAFPLGYEEFFTAYTATGDVERIETAMAKGGIAINLYRPVEAKPSELYLKLYKMGEKIALSDVLPSLENFGFKVISENPFEITPAGTQQSVWLHDFTMVARDGAEIDVATIRDNFQEAYARIWAGEMEDDGFNRLIVTAGLAWRDIALLRAYCKYLRQAAIPFSQAYMEATLNANPGIARDLVRLFHARFDPTRAEPRNDEIAKIAGAIAAALDAVANLDEDRILRRYLNAIQSTLRTNFFQRDAAGAVKDYIACKFDSQALDELPLPRPMVEIFVYSPRVEAIHLRGGKVARGGIRWSDRREDFRTEILGLMKAQMVKNAVIVPVGSKGGFVVKRPPQSGDREALMAEVVFCYKTLMRGLLDITDNLVAGTLRKPAATISHDGDDPYLVVAADKGTATFSDIANGVSREYGFWLDDAFASGGSAGYDHKKMGITARGAWECVKRHFRELGRDCQSQDFTAIGIGDMSGDVFGNAMLLSPHTRLIGAFNHQHIFLDPDPDPARNFAERRRLFDLPRSAWSDYDPKCLSKGGGIFERKAKSIRLSPEAKARFGLDRDQVTPNQLIRALLTAEIDLLFFGGIGTYIRAGDETDAEIGDRANDAIRIAAGDLRCRIIGEGANLGCSQRGRIEAALAGIRLNTDALDNSAGVDTSDHEVNIKILLNEAVGNGDLTMKQRDKLLATMTDDVAALVLRDNYLQSQALSVAAAQGYTWLDQQGRFMRHLERRNRLDRNIEFLPDDEILRQRLNQRHGLTRPENAVLLAYAKNSLYDELLPSDLPDDPQLLDDLVKYFPAALRETYAGPIARHRLRREIIATSVTNSMVNRMGATFVHVMREKTGHDAAAIARAYAITRSAFGLRGLWAAIEALDNRVAADIQTDLLIDISRLAEQATLWFLRNGRHPLDIAANADWAAPGIAAILAALPGRVCAEDRAEIETREASFRAAGLAEDLARHLAKIPAMASSLDIVRIATQAKLDVAAVAATYYEIGDRFRLDWLRAGARQLIGDNHWDRQAIFAIIDDLYSHQRKLAAAILEESAGATGTAAIAAWCGARSAMLDRAEALFADLAQVGKLELAMLTVANRSLSALLG